MRLRDRITALEAQNVRLREINRRMREAEPKPLPMTASVEHAEIMARLDAMSKAIIQIKQRVNDTDDTTVGLFRKMRKDVSLRCGNLPL